MDELIDVGQFQGIYYALRCLPINLHTENEVRDLFSLMTGYDLKRHIRLINNEGFHKDILEYPVRSIAWSKPKTRLRVISEDLTPDPEDILFFEKTSEVTEGKIIYREK